MLGELGQCRQRRHVYTFWEQVWNYGDVVLRETAGNDEKIECVWEPKKFAKVAMQCSHAADSE